MKTNPVIHQYVSVLLGAVIISGTVLMGVDKLTTNLKTGLSTGEKTVQNNDKPVIIPADKPDNKNNTNAPSVQDLSRLTINDAFVKGNKNAPITVIEFSDFQCPFCERWYQQVEKQLIKDYVDTGKVRFVFKPYAFLGPDSVVAVEGLFCAADQNKFWEYHDYLFDHQGQENSGWANKENLKKMAKTIGLNTTKFNDCLDKDVYKDKTAQELAEGQQVGVNGTPATFINGELIPGAQPYATFTEAIERKLKGQ